ncbi:hypothetical protein JZ751_027908 [Albula glossodonta]|uniref:Uncharacterized protein n=1 Tax=Albula glossodonta TaxID=121402 RepID=A0A8T2P7K1_9TELE|nr:hypothetical protein JZ751_027908 [Albula glossodonta]
MAVRLGAALPPTSLRETILLTEMSKLSNNVAGWHCLLGGLPDPFTSLMPSWQMEKRHLAVEQKK